MIIVSRCAPICNADGGYILTFREANGLAEDYIKGLKVTQLALIFNRRTAEPFLASAPGG